MRNNVQFTTLHYPRYERDFRGNLKHQKRLSVLKEIYAAGIIFFLNNRQSTTVKHIMERKKKSLIHNK